MLLRLLLIALYLSIRSMSVRLGLVMAVLFCFVYEASCRRSGLVLSHLTGKPVEGNWRFVLAGGRSLQAQGI